MGLTISEVIKNSVSRMDETTLGRMDSLDNEWQIKMIGDSLGLDTDSIKGMDDDSVDLALVNAATKAAELRKIANEKRIAEQGFTGPPAPPPGPKKAAYDETWSFDESPVGEFLSGAQADQGTKWFMNPNVSFREWMSDVTAGRGERATIFGKPVKGLGKHTPLYNPSGAPGEEKYNQKYVTELVRRLDMLEDPVSKITSEQGGSQFARISRDTSNIASTGSGYERMFSEDLSWRKSPGIQGEWKNVKGGGSIADFVQRPEYDKAVFLERSRYYNEALNALERLSLDSPARKQLASVMSKDEWKTFDPAFEPESEIIEDFLPIPEYIAKLEGWDRDPFVDVSDSLDAVKNYADKVRKTDDPTDMIPEDTSIAIPSIWLDPATEPFDSTTSTFVDELF